MKNNYIEIVQDFIRTYDHDRELIITEETLITKDLCMNGDDAAFFLTEFTKKFNINHSDFDFDEHFLSEGEIADNVIIKLFFGKKRGLKRKDLSVGDLIQALKTGKLI